MKSGSIIIIVLVIALVGLISYSSLKTTGYSIKTGEDVFEGVVTNIQLSPGKLSGVGVYDRSCNMVQGGLTNCDAGIQTEKGLLNFNYVHDMSKQECIGPDDKLIVEVLDATGKARVIR